MSSTTESLKKSATEAATEEPSAKKAKIAENEQLLDDKGVDNNNKTTASKQVDNNNTNIIDGDSKVPVASSGSSIDKAKIPTKSANGNDNNAKESKSEGNQDDIDDGGVDEDDDDEDDDGSGVFDPMTTSQLEAVEEIQTQISKLNESASEEILKVEQKYNKLRRPHFEKRSTLLKLIPNFWVTTLANHPMIAPMINTSEDEDCLHYMVNLDVEEFEDIKSGYTLKFHFVDNPYINNTVVEREIRHVNSDEVVTGASPLNYKDTPQGKNLKAIVERSIAQRPRNGQFQSSFFGWLSHSIDESGTDEIAEMIKDQIWPSPLEFFFAAADGYEGGGSDESDDEEEDYDEEADVDHAGIEEYLDDELDNDDDLDEEDDGEVGPDDDIDDDEEEDEDDEE